MLRCLGFKVAVLQGHELRGFGCVSVLRGDDVCTQQLLHMTSGNVPKPRVVGAGVGHHMRPLHAIPSRDISSELRCERCEVLATFDQRGHRGS